MDKYKPKNYQKLTKIQTAKTKTQEINKNIKIKMPKIFTQINLESFHFGDQFYGEFDWGFEALRSSFELILEKITLIFCSPKISIFQIFQTLRFQQIPIRGP